MRWMRRMTGSPHAALLAMAIAPIGCNMAGPTAIKEGRGQYNVAIQQTNNEQHLLNIVRLRYRDTPMFLEFASLSTNFMVELFGQANASLPEASLKSYGLLARAEYTEKPTVTYTPLRGEQFVRQILSPMDPKVMLLLYHSGWSVDRILRVCVQSMNGLRNAPSASGPTPSLAPEFDAFCEATAILRVLQRDHLLELGRASDAEEDELELIIDPAANDRADVARLRDLLGLTKNVRRFRFTTRQRNVPGQVVIVPRSINSALFYISQGVDVPAADEHAGRVTVTLTEQGERFEWNALLGDLFHVRTSRTRPRNAYVAVDYRGSWFYIDDSDLTSKSTFSMYTLLFALQSGHVKTSGPILTLPVAQ